MYNQNDFYTEGKRGSWASLGLHNGSRRSAGGSFGRGGAREMIFRLFPEVGEIGSSSFSLGDGDSMSNDMMVVLNTLSAHRGSRRCESSISSVSGL